MMDDLLPLLPTEVAGEPIIIAGPCSAETEEQVMDTARQLAANGVKVFRAGVWKPRTKPGGFEGIGVEALTWLQDVKAETGMLTATEVATSRHIEESLRAGVDVLWIGARTSANPFAMQEIADALAANGAGMPVLVKNPVNPDLELWIGALQRIYNAGVRRLGAIHRGFSAYGHHVYRNLPLWGIPIELRRRFPQLPLLCDPSHISGRRELISTLSQQALDMGFDGLIIESHCNPDCAWSDKAQQVTPEVLSLILGSLTTRDQAVSTESLSLLRRNIDEIDNELLEVLSRRMAVSRDIGRYKQEHRMPVVQVDRLEQVLRSRLDAARRLGLGEDFVRSILGILHEESVRQQVDIAEGNA